MLAPPGSGQRILSVAAHMAGEAVASPARVLGDGELKFKYLNPNTLLVLAGLPGGAAPEAAAAATLTAVVLDAVTGRVLFSQAHEVCVARAGRRGQELMQPPAGMPCHAGSRCSPTPLPRSAASPSGRHGAGACSAEREHGGLPLLGRRRAPLAGGRP